MSVRPDELINHQTRTAAATYVQLPLLRQLGSLGPTSGPSSSSISDYEREPMELKK